MSNELVVFLILYYHNHSNIAEGYFQLGFATDIAFDCFCQKKSKEFFFSVVCSQQNQLNDCEMCLILIALKCTITLLLINITLITVVS